MKNRGLFEFYIRHQVKECMINRNGFSEEEINNYQKKLFETLKISSPQFSSNFYSTISSDNITFTIGQEIIVNNMNELRGVLDDL